MVLPYLDLPFMLTAEGRLSLQRGLTFSLQDVLILSSTAELHSTSGMHGLLHLLPDHVE